MKKKSLIIKKNPYFCTLNWGSVVQLVRMPPCHGGGRGSESRPVRKVPQEFDEGTFFMPGYYVYILQSLRDSSYYTGFSTDVVRRLEEHNQGKSRYTKGKTPWKVVYTEEYESKMEALRREKFLKAQRNREFYARLITGKVWFPPCHGPEYSGRVRVPACPETSGSGPQQ